MSDISVLQKARLEYKPKLPKIFLEGDFQVKTEETILPAESAEEIQKLFPNSYGMPLVRMVAGKGNLNTQPLTVGVVLSGGPAPGGHNVIAGICDALKAANPKSRLLGFLNGPKGIVLGNAKELTPELVDQYRNTGGFDMIGSGRDKIESAEDLASCVKSLKDLGVNALVVIGGDDSNTNAAVLAEYFLAQKADIQVIGVPKTIDGDMKNQFIEASFGFDSAAKVYAELVGNICRDSMSGRKYWHFVKLMGRAASHVALEVALQTRPNVAIVSEEVETKKQTLAQVIDLIVSSIVKRAAAKKDYGVVLIPEGLLEFLVDFKTLLADLGKILRDDESVLKSFPTDEERREHINSKLNAPEAKLYSTLPESIQNVLLQRDKHGNIPVSQVETEKLLVDLVGKRLRDMKAAGDYKGSFSALTHFFGYEGRCVQPSNFDSDYCYALGYGAAQLVRAGLSGYTVFGANLVKPAEEWVMGGVPVTSMLNMEMRKGKMKPVIKKALVELDGAPFKAFAAQRDTNLVEDAFLFPGPIQYFGPAEICDARSKTLLLEKSEDLVSSKA